MRQNAKTTKTGNDTPTNRHELVDVPESRVDNSALPLHKSNYSMSRHCTTVFAARDGAKVICLRAI